MAAKYAALHEGGVAGWLALWFKGCDSNAVSHGNIVEFLNWAFFLDYYQPEDSTDIDHTKEQKWRDEFRAFAMKCIEGFTSHKIPTGHNPNLSFVHNTDDDRAVPLTYRPLLFYVCLWIGQMVTDAVFLYMLRFRYVHVNGLRVWYKIQSAAKQSAESKPILLIHGLGVHYMPYIPLISKLCRKSAEHDVFCIEIPWTAMSIWHFVPQSVWSIFSNSPSPSYIDSKLPASKRDFVEILQKMEDLILAQSGKPTRGLCERNEHNPLRFKWTLMGHSYGSFIVSGIYHYIEHNSSRNVDKSVNLPRLILLDPVTMCLSQPTTVSFLALKAPDWTTWFLQHLVAKELMIATTLNKYFHWFEYVIFPEDMMNDQVEHCVFTSAKDTLIPSELIAKGIDGVNERRSENPGCKQIHHVEFKHMYHAVWMGVPSCIQKIVDAV
eukprot:CAMPEP_0197077196 /NCGR_PEP_ID=MMETSP1384-20130603/212499_1 /TAXON_ID=29189 /ORGANISM="Ammonia sp." /LENGTH=435 /DNA_ID=CAMNT_0042516057 /DNA_START=589 /DNA_END=1896 /DNA_ORIENTATION=+